MQHRISQKKPMQLQDRNLKYTLYFRYSPTVLYVGFNLKPQERHTPYPQPQLLMTDTPPLIKLSCPPPSPVNFQLWGFHILSPVSSVCSVESASHRRSPVRPERKCVFRGSAAAGLMSEPMTAVVDPCSALRAFFCFATSESESNLTSSLTQLPLLPCNAW